MWIIIILWIDQLNRLILTLIFLVLKLDAFIIPFIQGNILSLQNYVSERTSCTYSHLHYYYSFMSLCCLSLHVYIGMTDTFVLYMMLGTLLVVYLNKILSFQTTDFTLKHSPAKITLISRRCNRRLGNWLWLLFLRSSIVSNFNCLI